MPKLKKKLTGNFTIINNTVLRDKMMGCTERGAYVTLVSMAEDWNFSVRGLAAIMPDGVTKISGALKRLETLGYLRRERLYENGKIKDWVYYIYDEPCNDDTSDNTDVENSDFFDLQDTDFSDTGNLDTENQHQETEHLKKPYDYIITKEEKTKKEVSSDQTSIDQSASSGESTVEKSSDDGLMDGYMSEKEIYTEVVKSNLEYADYALWAEESEGYMTVRELDEIVQMIVRTICSRKKTDRICGQEYPHEVIKSAMLKVDRICLENAIEQMKQTDNVRNYERYLISTLFNEANGRSFKENAETRNIDYAVKRDLGIQCQQLKRYWHLPRIKNQIEYLGQNTLR